MNRKCGPSWFLFETIHPLAGAERRRVAGDQKGASLLSIASSGELKDEAYRTKSLQHHPDKERSSWDTYTYCKFCSLFCIPLQFSDLSNGFFSEDKDNPLAAVLFQQARVTSFLLPWLKIRLPKRPCW